MRLDEKSIHDLVGAIYDGGADPARWQHALVQLSDATHSVGALLVARDRVDPMQSRYVHGRLDPELNQLFLSRYAKDCPWTRAADHAPTGTVYAGDAAVPARELIKTEFYAEILQPQQILHEGAAILARDTSRLVGVSVFRSPKIGHVDSEDLRLLSLVAPHFKRAAQIAWRLATHAAVDAAKSVALDRLDDGVLLFDASGNVLFANRAAEAIIALRDGLTVVREGLRAALPADTARLQTLIAETLQGSAGGTMRLTRPSLAEPFLLLVAPARGNWYWSIDPMPAVVIFVTALDQAVAPDLRLLAPAFELTATEAKIAVSIAAGGGVPATARAIRISPNTVHTHLQRIFRKLGVNDQAALVRVLMRAVAVLPQTDATPGKPPTQTPSAKPSNKTYEPRSSPASPNQVTRRRARYPHCALRPDYLVLEARLVAAPDDEDLAAKPMRTKAEYERGGTKADHSIACTRESEVRRRADGSIDIAFYKERAQRLRREATLKLCRSIREVTRAGSGT